MMGTREIGTIQFYSAQASDYLQPTFRSLLYGRWSDGAVPERALFPRLMPIALTAAAPCMLLLSMQSGWLFYLRSDSGSRAVL